MRITETGITSSACVAFFSHKRYDTAAVKESHNETLRQHKLDLHFISIIMKGIIFCTSFPQRLIKRTGVQQLQSDVKSISFQSH